MNTDNLKQQIITAFGISTIFLAVPCHALEAILTVNAEQARGLDSKAIDIKVWTGRATAIDFSGVNERITQIFLADPLLTLLMLLMCL